MILITCHDGDMVECGASRRGDAAALLVDLWGELGRKSADTVIASAQVSASDRNASASPCAQWTQLSPSPLLAIPRLVVEKISFSGSL